MNTFRNILALTFFICGFLFIIGAAGESDMYEEMGQYLPITVTIEKVGVGLGFIIVGSVIKGKE